MLAKNVSSDLDQVDAVREELMLKLPWYKRPFRRYLTGDAFVAYNLSSLFTWPQGIGVGFALSKLWAGWLITHPGPTTFVIKAWGYITSAAVGAWSIVTHSA